MAWFPAFLDRSAGGMTVQDVEFLDKLTHMAKSLKTTIAMMEAEEGGESRRSYFTPSNSAMCQSTKSTKTSLDSTQSTLYNTHRV